ncbi:hypothetical protein EGK14_19030 [Erwinia sp. 198]|nr:hypothetical protein EGK14_19030 [Erwinia sp. 198]
MVFLRLENRDWLRIIRISQPNAYDSLLATRFLCSWRDSKRSLNPVDLSEFDQMPVKARPAPL